MPIFLPLSDPARTCVSNVYLLMDVDVGWVRWSPCGVPTQKLQLLEHLFNWRGRRGTKHVFKPSFLNVFSPASPLPPQIVAQFRIINPFYPFIVYFLWAEYLNVSFF